MVDDGTTEGQNAPRMTGEHESPGPPRRMTADLVGPPPGSSHSTGPRGDAGEAPTVRKRPRRIALAVGEVVPSTPYRLLRWLGDGGMGAVFEAEHIDTERRVAVKVLHAQRRSLQWVVQGFRNEARASARIGSPNIVDIYDFKELDDGRLLIAMEFLDGPTLHEEVDREPLAWPRLVDVSRQICKGLSAAHRAEIVHRDIKPENIILIRRDRREDFVKLLDFGVAHFARDGDEVRMSGTAQYMAPEAAEGTSDIRADIYSVGCLLYTLAVGEPPFEGETSSEVLKEQHAGPPTPPSKRTHREVPPSFDALVLRCLATEPSERFESMDELEAALCELQLECRWTTAWDDLPAPEVEPARRDRIEAGLRELSGRTRRRSRWPGLVVAGLLAATTIAVLAWPRPPATTTVTDDAVSRHAQAAKSAAARFYFVYPPVGEPHSATAYRELLALEALGLDEARTRGAELRKEFAATLVRLGDRYWDFEGARPFAYEYYASALVFVEDEHARERTGLTPAALERLRARAANGDFNEHELLATEPLVALAEPDAEARVQKLEQLRDEQVIPATVAASLDRVLQSPEHQTVRVARAETHSTTGRPMPPLEPEVDDLELPSGTTGADDGDSSDGPPDADDGAQPADPLPKTPTRDPATARTLIAQAQSAEAAGNRQQAETLYNRALEADSRNLAALDGLASIAFRKANYAQSVKHLQRAVKLGSRNADRWLALGDSYFKTVRYAEARGAYERAQELGSVAAGGRLAKLDRKVGATDSPQ